MFQNSSAHAHGLETLRPALTGLAGMRPRAVLPLVAVALPVLGMRMAGAPRRRVTVRRVHAGSGALPRLATGVLLPLLTITVMPGRSPAAPMWLLALGIVLGMVVARPRVRMRMTMLRVAATGLAVIRLAAMGLTVMGVSVAGLDLAGLTILALAVPATVVPVLMVPVLAVADLTILTLAILSLVAARVPRFAASLLAVMPAAAMAALAARFRIAMMAVGRPPAAGRATPVPGMALGRT